ncbi:hypothetical protein KI387_044449, partial [Taxus chinensis]
VLTALSHYHWALIPALTSLVASHSMSHTSPTSRALRTRRVVHSLASRDNAAHNLPAQRKLHPHHPSDSAQSLRRNSSPGNVPRSASPLEAIHGTKTNYSLGHILTWRYVV